MQGIFDDGSNVMIRCWMKNSPAYLVSTDKDIFLFSGDAHAAVKMPEAVAIQKMVQLSAREEISKLEMVRV
jgi:hypothetical protein